VASAASGTRFPFGPIARTGLSINF
jgi:hypothetical protein